MTNSIIHMDREEVLQLEKSLSREWFEFDGLGGFAANTVIMCPTRRYHGLLVGRPQGHDKRHVFLSRFEESLHGRGKSFALSMARYPDVIAPHGYKSFENFELKPYPVFTYQIGRVTAVREILMVRGQRTVLCRYRFRGAAPDIELRLRPLLAFREADLLTQENLALDPRVERLSDGLRVRPYASLPSMQIRIGGAEHSFEADPVWYRNLLYIEEVARGYEGLEDNFSPGILHMPLDEEIDIVVASSLEEGDAVIDDPLDLWERESYRRSQFVAQLDNDVRGTLLKHREDFLFQDRNGRHAVMAGYPWFGERGRDTFVALPGLTLAAGDLERCTKVLEGALPYFRKGLLPSHFCHSPAESRYDSADVGLWFARAVRLWELAGGSKAKGGEKLLKQKFYPALRDMAEALIAGTELNVHATDDGLLWAGTENDCATWMDMRALTGPVTPRHGHAVEIQALWYFLLSYLEKLAKKYGDGSESRRWAALRQKCGESFLERFWLGEQGYLADCVREDEVDTSIRPNMVIAASLEFSPLDREQRVDIVHVAEVGLLTPRGLRTLSPRNPKYHGKYQGGPDERDQSYHNGLGLAVAGRVLRRSLSPSASPQQATRRVRQRAARWLRGQSPFLWTGADLGALRRRSTPPRRWLRCPGLGPG
jgi:predicted glycogen debranching enzyme